MAIKVQSKKMNLELSINNENNIFTAEVINNFLKSLPPATDITDTISITGCVGASACDISLATSKGYKVTQ